MNMPDSEVPTAAWFKALGHFFFGVGVQQFHGLGLKAIQSQELYLKPYSIHYTP